MTLEEWEASSKKLYEALESLEKTLKEFTETKKELNEIINNN